jgi:hypothetical protein
MWFSFCYDACPNTCDAWTVISSDTDATINTNYLACALTRANFYVDTSLTAAIYEIYIAVH